MTKVKITIITLIVVYFTIANYCNFKLSLGVATTNCEKCK